MTTQITSSAQQAAGKRHAAARSKKAQTATTRPRKAPKGERKAETHKTATPNQARGVTLPGIGHIEMPHVGLPHVAMPAATSLPAGVLWIGGLGAVAALGIVEWPVAAAIAVGTWIAEQRAETRIREDLAHPADRQT